VLTTAAGPRYAEQAGADALLPKPFELQQVEALLQRFLAEA
jgi:CheY-like chemotaxis protein